MDVAGNERVNFLQWVFLPIFLLSILVIIFTAVPQKRSRVGILLFQALQKHQRDSCLAWSVMEAGEEQGVF